MFVYTGCSEMVGNIPEGNRIRKIDVINSYVYFAENLKFARETAVKINLISN